MVDSQPFSVVSTQSTHLFFRVQSNNFFSVNLSACLLAGRWPAHGFEFHFGFSKKQLIWFNLLLWGKLVLAAFNSGVHKFADFHVEVETMSIVRWIWGWIMGKYYMPLEWSLAQWQCPEVACRKAASEIGTVDNMFDLCSNSDSHVHHISSYSIYIDIMIIRNHIPVVPHKAVAEVSKIGNQRRGELLWCMDGRANPLMDRKVVVIFGVVAVVTSPKCSEVQCNCSWSVLVAVVVAVVVVLIKV